MVLSKNEYFTTVNSGANKGRKKSFFDVLEGKECFLDEEKCCFKKIQKNRNFSKEVSPWFLSKNRKFYQGCLLPKLDQKTRFMIFWTEKNAF